MSEDFDILHAYALGCPSFEVFQDVAKQRAVL
jgi:hypothetical protein